MNHWSKQPTPNVMEHPQEGKMAALPFILRFYGNELKKTLETESTNCVVFFFSHFGFLRQVFSVVLFFCFLYSPGHPGTHSVDKAGLELRNLSASASQVHGPKACATTSNYSHGFYLCICYPVAKRLYGTLQKYIKKTVE